MSRRRAHAHGNSHRDMVLGDVERLPFEWNYRWIFLYKWNCTFSHQENGTDWAVSFDSKFRMQVFSRAIKLKSSNHESKSKTQEPTAKT